MPASLLARDLTLSFGRAVVLESIDLTVTPESRVGVVGPNGCGKTTLLRVLAGLQRPDRGSVMLSPPDTVAGYLAQEPERAAAETVFAALARRTGVAAATAELDTATAALARGGGKGDDRYSAALDRWLRLGGADFEARVGAVCADVGLAETTLPEPTATLSGGQAAKAALAAVLLSRFDVLLLDEPTNDLDFDGLDRLEAFVRSTAVGVVIVSHDRAFLERTITSVLEIDAHTHRATLFNGGWLAYLEERAVARRHAEEAYAGYRARRSDLEDRARRQRQWAVSGVRREARQPRDNDKAQRDFRINRTEKLAAKVRITDKALARLEVVEKPWEGWDLHLEIAAAGRSGDVVARLDNAMVERGEFRLGPLDLEIRWAERVAILGPNGSGKTTLLDALLGRVPLATGVRWLGPGVVVGELDQRRSLLAGDRPLGSAFEAITGLPHTPARSLLAKFGLSATHVTRPIDSLSPGERTRALLALFMARGVNCLVLDEPTNHLDLPAIEQLEQALATWEGTLLLVTHDRRLLEAVAVDRTIAL